jgi:hypothetical protein
MFAHFRTFHKTEARMPAFLTFAAGWLYEWWGGAAFWVMALLCVAAIPLTPALDPRNAGIRPP